MQVIRSSQLPYVAASHEDPTKPGSLKKILFRAEDFTPPRKIQMINWAKIAPEKQFAAHYHEDMDEIFIIIRGSGEITIDGDMATVVVGDAIRIKPGGVHTMRNTGREDMEYIVVGVSGGKGGKTIIL